MASRFQVYLSLLFILHSTTTTGAQSTAAAPAPPGPTNITGILEKAGQFNTLIRLFAITKEGDQINTQLNNSNQGMTVFAPTDNAFAGLGSGTLNSLSDQEKVELVQFHVIPNYIPTTQFETISNPLRTLAGDSASNKYPLNVTTSGSQVNLTTGVVNASVANAIYSDGSLAVYQVDKVLLPMSLFGPPTPAAAPAPESGDTKKKTDADDTPVPEGAASAKVSGAVDVRRHLHGLMAGSIGTVAFIGMFCL